MTKTSTKNRPHNTKKKQQFSEPEMEVGCTNEMIREQL